MRKRIARAFAVAAGFLVATVSTVALASMVSNGSYETGPAQPPSYQMELPGGSTAITGWQVTRAPINLVWNVIWESAEGERSLALNPTTAGGGIAQTFPTVPGVGYRVSFKLSGESFTVPTLKHLRVLAAGQQADFSYDSADNWHWDMRYVPHTWSFTANASSTTVEFVSLMTAQSSPVIDDVSVELVTTDVPPRSAEFALSVSSPNPMRGAAAFTFSLPVAGTASLVVTDLAGRRVATLADGAFAAGSHPARWAAGAAPGVYNVTLRAGERMLTRRFVLLR